MFIFHSGGPPPPPHALQSPHLKSIYIMEHSIFIGGRREAKGFSGESSILSVKKEGESIHLTLKFCAVF